MKTLSRSWVCNMAKKTFDNPLSPNELRGSGFFPARTPQTTTNPPQASKERVSKKRLDANKEIKSQKKQSRVENERTNVRTNERTNERLSFERVKTRHTFDILKDQLVSLKEIRLERETAFSKKCLLGDLVQEALDMFISKERNSD